MDVGIVTMIGNNNYGNRLQNYALQEALKALGHKPITIRNNIIFNTEVSLPRVLAWRTWCCLRGQRGKKPQENNARRRKFEEFNRNIQFTKRLYYGSRKYDSCDYYIAGSDQIWNPYDRMYPLDLLCFARPEKRISYAASFGISALPEEKKTLARRELEKFKAISIREDTGKRIVEELTGRTDVKVVIDPTMLLTAQQWDQVAKKPKMLETDRYILNYFLGSVSDKQKAAIDAVAKEHGCEVINILDKNSPYYACGPAEFLYLEKHAYLICTDSFHSSVFAVLYNRPFVVFERPAKVGWSMNSRLETLLDKFQLTGRTFNGEKITEENLYHDYSNAYVLLEKEREAATYFLKQHLI